MSYKSFLILLAILLTCIVLNGQDVMSLNDCMSYAVENAPKAKKKLAENDNLKINYRDAALRFAPEIYGNVSGVANFGRSIDPETNTYANYQNFSNNYSLNAEYTIFNGFSVVNNYRIAKNAKNMGVTEAQQIEDEICLEVIQAYYNVLYYLKMNDLAQQQLQEAQANLVLTKRQEQQGVKGYAEVAEVEAAVAEKDYNLINMQNRCANAYSVLKQKMYFPLLDSLNIDRDILVQIDAADSEENTQDLIDHAKETLPSILISENKIREAELTLKTSRWGLLPSLNAYASYSTNYAQALDGSYKSDPFWDQIDSRQGQYVQLSMYIPIFSGLERQSNIRRNKNKVHIAQYDYDEKMKSVEVEIELAVQDKDGAMKAFVQADKRANAQRIAYNLNLKRYEQGIISAIELQTSSNNMLSAEAERLNAFFQYNLKYKVVQYYKGVRYLE